VLIDRLGDSGGGVPEKLGHVEHVHAGLQAHGGERVSEAVGE
jgi:hypothetical protein